jgi:hypothetical protein
VGNAVARKLARRSPCAVDAVANAEKDAWFSTMTPGFAFFSADETKSGGMK